MDRHDRPGFDAEHARNSLGLPPHGCGRKWDASDQYAAPTSLQPGPVSLGVHYPHAGRPDNQVVNVCAAARQGEVVQYHPMPPGQMLEQGGCGELSCGAPGPAARVMARPQDHGRASGAQRKAKDGPIRPRGELCQPKAGGHPVGDDHKRHERQGADHKRQPPGTRPPFQLPRIQRGPTCTVGDALTSQRHK